MMIPIYIGYPTYVSIWLQEGCRYTTVDDYLGEFNERYYKIKLRIKNGIRPTNYYNTTRSDRR